MGPQKQPGPQGKTQPGPQGKTEAEGENVSEPNWLESQNGLSQNGYGLKMELELFFQSRRSALRRGCLILRRLRVGAVSFRFSGFAASAFIDQCRTHDNRVDRESEAG